MRTVIRLGNILLVNLRVAPSCPNDQIDNLSYSFRFVFVETSDPLGSDVVKARSACE